MKHPLYFVGKVLWKIRHTRPLKPNKDIVDNVFAWDFTSAPVFNNGLIWRVAQKHELHQKYESYKSKCAD